MGSMSDVNHLVSALKLIAGMEEMTLLGPRDDTEHYHEIGAHKAFNQCALIAITALEIEDWMCDRLAQTEGQKVT